MSYPTVLITTIESLRLRLFNKIKAGEFSLVAFIAIPSIRQAQIVARTGNEGIIIDCEHGHIGDDAVHNSVAAISALSVSPVVRIEPMIFSSMPLIQVPTASWYPRSTTPKRPHRLSHSLSPLPRLSVVKAQHSLQSATASHPPDT
ncbi:hypothetical protein PENANT_c004G04227 [Penicillium antarcticum]|uniref:HpcH/HpaI aldolase/citrate lyase domain-containing protein n=1 Tax=Penicillium antarcticum TaxID=416450 RepID=A0A1V6QGJ0_9EURO|nr:hypothetical protein PENANT_c004G04227 [Penicillium antarcticum]